MSAPKVEMGRRLFYDRRLSGNGTYACASCHQQSLAFADGKAHAVGSTGELHRRSAMSLTNVAYGASLTWVDPGARTLEHQMRVPMFGEQPVEMGMAGHEEEVLTRLRDDGVYRELFALAFPGAREPLSMEQVIQAIAAFERTLLSGDSPYDRLVFRSEHEALSASAKRGMKLFFSEALACSECHGGFNLSGPVEFSGSPIGRPDFHNNGLYDLDGRGAYPAVDRGLLEHTGKKRDMGRFRAPTLRNIELTAPYMHDGSLASLEEVVAHYARGGAGGPLHPSPLRSPKVRGFKISPGETRDLVEFLKSLTDRSFVTDPRFSDPFTEERSAAAR